MKTGRSPKAPTQSTAKRAANHTSVANDHVLALVSELLTAAEHTRVLTAASRRARLRRDEIIAALELTR